MAVSRQKKRLEIQRQIVRHFEEKIPNFSDIFDERTFYIFFICLVLIAILIAVVLGIFCKIKIKDADELKKEKEKRERQRKQKMAEKFFKEKLANLKENTPEYAQTKLKLDILYKEIERDNKFFDYSDSDDFDDDSDVEGGGSTQNLIKTE